MGATALSRAVSHCAFQGLTSVLPLSQPIPEVYSLFDSVILLQDGHSVYSGARDGATPQALRMIGCCRCCVEAGVFCDSL
jgi:ABC-type multidrug transport system ATPase subunit